VKLKRFDAEPVRPLVRLEAELEKANGQIMELKQSLREQKQLAAGLAQELAWVWNRWKDAERRAELGGGPPATGVIPLRTRKQHPALPPNGADRE
jgi:hypothetical protein